MDMVANTTELVNLKGSRPEIDDLIQQIVSESYLFLPPRIRKSLKDS